MLAEHVVKSLEQVSAGPVRLPESVLTMPGMSSIKVRMLLNALCSRPGARYLEIGAGEGSTLISALHGNSPERALAMDNFGSFGHSKENLVANVHEHLGWMEFLDADLQHPPGPRAFYDMDCFSHECGMLLDSGVLLPFDTYFYDGRHTIEAQFRAFAFFDRVLADEFIAVVDDWNLETTRAGTRAAFSTLGYSTEVEYELEADGNGDVAKWWNGLFVAVVHKQPRQPVHCPRCTSPLELGELATCQTCGYAFLWR